MSKGKHIHIIGIAGSAMSPLAGMLREKGFRVTGSDAGVYPPASTLLESLGISFFHKFDASKSRVRRRIWWSSATSSRAEIRNWKKCSIAKFRIARCRRCSKRNFCRASIRSWSAARTARPRRPRCWRGFFMWQGRNRIFWSAELPKISARATGSRAASEFILEGDEYETAFWDRGPKFFHYHPDDLIITSLEYDHADIYPDFDVYQLAFKRLVNLVPRSGRVVIWGDTEQSGPALRAAAAKAFCPVETYGFSAQNDWIASKLCRTMAELRFRLTYRGKMFGDFELVGDGAAQRVECVAAIAVAHGRGIAGRRADAKRFRRFGA